MATPKAKQSKRRATLRERNIFITVFWLYLSLAFPHFPLWEKIKAFGLLFREIELLTRIYQDIIPVTFNPN